MANLRTDGNTKGPKGWLVVVVSIVGVLLIMAGLALLVYMRVPIPHNSEVFTQDDWRAFADMFGAVAGTFFSAVAFAVLIYSSWMQREELSLQRQELRDTREELKRQADAQEASEKALAAQVELAQLTSRLEASRTVLEYYDSIYRDVMETPTDDDSRRGVIAMYRGGMRDAPSAHWLGIDDAALYELSTKEVETLFAHFLRAVRDSRVKAASEMHALRDVLRERAPADLSSQVEVDNDARFYTNAQKLLERLSSR